MQLPVFLTQPNLIQARTNTRSPAVQRPCYAWNLPVLANTALYSSRMNSPSVRPASVADTCCCSLKSPVGPRAPTMARPGFISNCVYMMDIRSPLIEAGATTAGAAFGRACHALPVLAQDCSTRQHYYEGAELTGRSKFATNIRAEKSVGSNNPDFELHVVVHGFTCYHGMCFNFFRDVFLVWAFVGNSWVLMCGPDYCVPRL